MMDVRERVYVAGHRGVVGAAIVRRLQALGFTNLLLRSHDELDLADEGLVQGLFKEQRPSYVFLAAGRVGGIRANRRAPVEFLVQNLRIQTNVLLAAQQHGVKGIVFLASSCIYPRDAPQPMSEAFFMGGPLEPTNESYAVAKIAGIRLAKALFEQTGMRTVLPVPCNVYGPGDHFDFDRSHVVSALVRRIWDAHRAGAPSVRLWGSGTARREFLFVDDLADACLFLMDKGPPAELINVGSGMDMSIAELAAVIARAVGFSGQIEWDLSQPDGMPRKLVDVSRLHALGWHHTVSFESGLQSVLLDYQTRSAQRTP